MSRYANLNIINFAKKYGCEILNHCNSSTISNKIIIKSRCGHITTETINNFVKKKIGIYCKECMEKIIYENNQIQLECSNSKCKKLFVPDKKSFLFCSKFCSYSREKDEITRRKISMVIKNNLKKYDKNEKKLYDKNIYSKGNTYLNNLIGEKFNFEITNRCCYYNHIIKPKNILSINTHNEKIWFPVEIKYSNSSTEQHYYFTMRKKYKDILIICVSLEDNKIWIFPPNILEYTTKLKINKGISNRFEKYLVDNDNLIKVIKNYYYQYPNLMVSKNENLFEKISDSNSHIKVEYEYKKKRLDYIQFIDFQNPISNFEPYNFVVNGFKVQECVSFISNSNKNQIVSIHKKQNGFSLPFNYTDSDFYWIHERNCNNFYLIPSTILYEQGYLYSESQKGKTTLNIDTNKSWLSKYEFSYDFINEEPHKTKLLEVFGLKNSIEQKDNIIK